MIVENDLLEADFAVLEEVVALVARGFLRAFQEGLWGLVLGVFWTTPGCLVGPSP